ncbi:hypothetical protein JW992_11985 [candidate division KSB1 bacterium]|nr:hypothetical protein [candidate division KSB1 bacterium]
MKQTLVMGMVLTALPLFAQISDQEVLDYLERTLDHHLTQQEGMTAQWKALYTGTEVDENRLELIGYEPPDFFVHMADIAAFLYQQTGEKSHARLARDIMVSLEGYRRYFPERFKHRVEYSRGVPVVRWFRSLPVYIRAYERTKDSGFYSEKERKTVAESVAASVDIIFAFPEWGAMNRTMLRAESLIAAATCFPDHPRAGEWKKMAEILASDSLEKWEIEDAQIYHSVWLRPYIQYLDLSNRSELFASPMMKFYFDYFVSLLTPNRAIPEFGDGRWNDDLTETYLCLERGAKIYRCGEMKWAADEILDRLLGAEIDEISNTKRYTALQSPSLQTAGMLITRHAYVDSTIQPREPHYRSGDALEEVISKKIVFRSDWSESATYLLLNYKDEGYYSILQKDYLKNILAVEEEKMHHGHSDENSICLLMKNGAVLLSDGNYREKAPSGEYGAFRADIFHNRMVVRPEKKSLNQPLVEIFRNSGAYNDEVRTSKIDFQAFPACEYSRTRLIDPRTCYQWDRTLVRLMREPECFVVFDALKFTKTGYFTAAALWHTRQIVDCGEDWFVTRIDSLSGTYANPGKMELLILFLGDHPVTLAEQRRDKQTEKMLIQSVSQHFFAGQIETFAALLIPIEPGTDPRPILQRYRLLRQDQDAFALAVHQGNQNAWLGIKTDLDRDLLKEEIRPRYTYDSGKLNYGPVETDADLVFLEETANGPKFSATHLVKLIYADQVLFDTPESQFFQVWGKSDRKGRAKWRRWDNY